MGKVATRIPLFVFCNSCVFFWFVLTQSSCSLLFKENSEAPISKYFNKKGLIIKPGNSWIGYLKTKKILGPFQQNVCQKFYNFYYSKIHLNIFAVNKLWLEKQNYGKHHFTLKVINFEKYSRRIKCTKKNCDLLF